VSSQLSTSLRQNLKARQAATVERLLASGAEVLEEVGHEALTIRLVAARAGVSPATAYTYLASKDHLFSELFWQLVKTEGGPRLTGRTPTKRLRQATQHLADLIAARPELAAAVTKSFLSSDPEAARIRLQVGSAWVDLFREAIGDDADPDVLSTLAFAFSGALLQVGMGILSYDELADALDRVIPVIMKGNE
jgi:AcrR family transcriptional regulator